MRSKLEQELAKLMQGDHICSIYENTAEQQAVVVAFLVAGLAQGERCVYIADNRTVDEIVPALAAAGVNVARERQRGALRMMTPQDTYVRNGEFVPKSMIDLIHRLETEALADGFSGLRLTSEPTWTFGPEPACDRLIEYEALLNDWPTNSRSIILCQYHQSRFGASCIHEVLRTHPVSILGDQVYTNPYFEPPELVLSRGQYTSDELERKRVAWWIAELKRMRAAEQERERAKTAQRESEGRLREIVDLIPAAVYVCDKNGRIQQYNSMAVELWGREPRADEDVRFCGAIQHLRLDGSVIPRDELPIVETIRNGMPVRDKEVVIVRPDGSRVVVMVNIASITNAEGAPVGAINCFLDVTEHHQAEDKLRQSERRLAEAQQVAHIGSWERDLRTNVVTWSDELYRLFGLQAHQGDVSYQRFLELVLPQDVDRIRAQADEAIRERRQFSCDYRITRPDGSIRVLHDRGGVVLDDNGDPIRLVGTAQDVTERRKAEGTLQESQQLLHMVLNTLPVGVVVTDRAADIILANPAAERIWGGMIVSGRERWEHSKGFWHDSGKRVDPEGWASARALSEGQTTLNELIDIETFDGRHKTIQNSAAPIRNADGIIVGAVVVNEDVTERVRTQTALGESADRLQRVSRRVLAVQEEERRHLARELHDEVGQLLSALQLLLSLKDYVQTEAVKTRFEQARAIVDELLEKVRAMSFDLRPAVLDQLGFIPALLEFLENYTKRSGVHVRFKHNGVEKRFAAEVETTAYRIVQEALTNAARHAGIDEVTVRVWATHDLLSAQIEDRGRGFDAEAVLAGPQSIGLAGMRERVMLLNGQLTIDSRPGGGTRITAELPLLSPKETDEA